MRKSRNIKAAYAAKALTFPKSGAPFYYIQCSLKHNNFDKTAIKKKKRTKIRIVPLRNNVSPSFMVNNRLQ